MVRVLCLCQVQSRSSWGNYVLVGDAAGMVLPSNGAGITIAMIGGRIAGNVIAEHLKSGLPLEEYEKIWKKQMGKVMANSKRSFKVGSYYSACLIGY